MNITNKTVLITGGSAGIGFEIAKQLTEKGNKVIILGRNAERLEQAAAKLNNVTAIQCDVTKEKEVKSLAERIVKEFPELSVLINNAGSAFVYKLGDDGNTFEKAADEMMTNYLSIINLTDQLLPVLRNQPEAGIVNVTSIVALVPSGSIPTYSASKAALRSYTQLLRLSLAKTTGIKVYELMPPLVNTDFSKEIGGHNGIAPSVVAGDLINGLENDIYEIHVGQTAGMYQLSLSAPADALAAMNGN